MQRGAETLQRRLGYSFSDKDLLSRALTHRSYSAENNERLEFLGDSILNFVIAENLYTRFEAAQEGKLSRLRAKMVERQTLAEIAREFNLGDYLIMGTGEVKSGGFKRDSILSDTLEALIGAMFQDASLEVVSERIIAWFRSRLETLSVEKSFKDAKSRLQEFLQSRQLSLPHYRVVDTKGKSHDPTFFIECETELLTEPASGEGSSLRIAEQNAALKALVVLGIEHYDHW
jgi:ribonuclease-3